MSHLQKLLDDVLAGRTLVNDTKTFALLRRFAPNKLAELNALEEEARKGSNDMSNINTATLPRKSEAINLTRNELEAILAHRRPTNVDELEWLLDHANDRRLLLSETEELELRNLCAQLLARQHRALLRYCREVTEEFAAKVLGVYWTPYGDLSRSEVELLEHIRLQATRAIHDCADHKRDRCSCWRDARERLFEIRDRAGDNALGVASLALWNTIEALARDRPQQLTTDQTEGPPGIVYNWRYFKCPEYVNSVVQQQESI